MYNRVNQGTGRSTLKWHSAWREEHGRFRMVPFKLCCLNNNDEIIFVFSLKVDHFYCGFSTKVICEFYAADKE